MPLNLSALVRYKTINNCLSSIRKYSIDELVDRCSDALSDYKGERTSVSERTVREDIKNMRSDMLGFNAPIIQRDGYYFYEDRSFDLLNIFIREEKLAREIMMLLEDLSEKIEHPKLKPVVEQLRGLVPEKSTEKIVNYDIDTEIFDLPSSIDEMKSDSVSKPKEAEKRTNKDKTVGQIRLNKSFNKNIFQKIRKRKRFESDTFSENKEKITKEPAYLSLKDIMDLFY